MSNIDIAKPENIPMSDLISRMEIINQYLKDRSLTTYQYETEPTKEQLIKDYRDAMDIGIICEMNSEIGWQ